MSNDDELSSPLLDQPMHLREQCQLSLRRKCRLRLIQEPQSVADPILQDGEEGFTMRALMQGPAAISRIRITLKIRILPAFIEKRCKMGLELRPHKEPVFGPLTK